MQGMKRFLGWCARHAWVVAMGAAVFVLTALTPLLAEDFPNLRGFYRLSPLAPGQFPTWGTFVGVPDFWGNLFRLTWEHWSGAGASLVDNTGRFAAAFLLRLLVGMPHWLFAALNATVWVWLTWCVWRLGGRSRRWLGATAAAMFVFREQIKELTGCFHIKLARGGGLHNACKGGAGAEGGGTHTRDGTGLAHAHGNKRLRSVEFGANDRNFFDKAGDVDTFVWHGNDLENVGPCVGHLFELAEIAQFFIVFTRHKAVPAHDGYNAGLARRFNQKLSATAIEFDVNSIKQF